MEETTPNVAPTDMTDSQLDEAVIAMGDDPSALDTLSEENNKTSEEPVTPAETVEETPEEAKEAVVENANRDGNFKKLLRQRNEARSSSKSKDERIAELEATIDGNQADEPETAPDLPESIPDDLDAKVSKMVADALGKRDIDTANQSDKVKLLEESPTAEAHMDEIEQVMEVHKTLTYEQAHRMVDPLGASQAGQAMNAGSENATDMGGSESAALSEDIAIKDLTDDQLEKKLNDAVASGQMKL